VCQRFAKRVMQTLRRLALREHGLRSVQSLHSGVLLVVQRFRSDLGLYVHIHALAMDGCFEADCGDEVRFLPLAGLSAAHLVSLVPPPCSSCLAMTKSSQRSPSRCGTNSYATDRRPGCPG
jgi:hypothetical protein